MEALDNPAHRPEIGWKKACVLLLLWAATALASHGQTLTTLVAFNGTNGGGSEGILVQGTDGNFYGTTTGGSGASACGTVFKMTPGGTLTTLHSFDCTDGQYPFAGLVLAADGNFYGTTAGYGGSNEDCTFGPCGTVFKITSGGTLTTIHSFDGTDGSSPYAGLIQATDGNLYGTTFGGGTNGNGTIFKITSAGTLTTLHRFDGTHGSSPYAGLIQATDGNLYGTTANGGAHGSGGTAFKITLGGALSTLYSFCETKCTDGANPFGGLVQGTDGNFYGTTTLYGANENCADGCGTVFKMTPGGTLTTLHTFDRTDGSHPDAGLVQATDGNFYGTTSGCGANGNCTDGLGTIFKITAGGPLTTLHSFDGSDGSNPVGGLIQAADGNFYGTTARGAVNANGTVFSLNLDLSSPGKPSLSGRITDQSLAGNTLTLTLVLTNTGTGEAKNIWINAVALRNLGSSGIITLTAPALPLPVGDLAVGASAAVPLSFTVPSTVTKFSITENGTVQDPSGSTLHYSIGQVVFP
jgi:uncharacterized repeat protein (TIGR03803 family)